MAAGVESAAAPRGGAEASRGQASSRQQGLARTSAAQRRRWLHPPLHTAPHRTAAGRAAAAAGSLGASRAYAACRAASATQGISPRPSQRAAAAPQASRSPPPPQVRHPPQDPCLQCSLLLMAGYRCELSTLRSTTALSMTSDGKKMRRETDVGRSGLGSAARGALCARDEFAAAATSRRVLWVRLQCRTDLREQIFGGRASLRIGRVAAAEEPAA
jgi:hypothetical protein